MSEEKLELTPGKERWERIVGHVIDQRFGTGINKPLSVYFKRVEDALNRMNQEIHANRSTQSEKIRILEPAE